MTNMEEEGYRLNSRFANPSATKHVNVMKHQNIQIVRIRMSFLAIPLLATWLFKGFHELYKSKNLGHDNFNFGKGGGLSIIFKGDAKHNRVRVSDCTFQGNLAHYGGGFFVGYYDNVHDNIVVFNNTYVIGNSNCYVQNESSHKWDSDESGGGAKFQFSLQLDNLLGVNIINVSNSIFRSNEGISGGGVYISSTVGLASFLNAINFERTRFYNNSAFLGSALYLSQRFFKCDLFC